MAKDIKPINLDDEDETTDVDMSNDSLGEESIPTDDTIDEEIELTEVSPVEPIEEATEGVLEEASIEEIQSTEENPAENSEEGTEEALETVAVEEEKITDAQEVQNVMLAYFSKKTGKTIRKFFEVFLRATDEYPDLSMQDYKSFLETIEQNVPESDYPKYKELFAKVLVARKKRIQEHDQKRMFEKSKADTLKEIEDIYQQLDRSKYAPSGLSTIEKAYGNAKTQVEQENNPKNLSLISKSFESSIKSAKTKKQTKRKKIFILSGAVAAVVLLAAILCIGAIPKVSYKTISTTEELVKNVDGEYEQITVKYVSADGISGLFLPFHYPMKTVDLRYVSDENIKLIGIEEEAFKGENIETVYLPSEITLIPEEAFANCKNLKEINYFDETNDLSYIESIQANAFKGCTSLEPITLSGEIDSIHSTAFSECSKDFTIHYWGDTASWNSKHIYPGVPVEVSEYYISIKGYENQYYPVELGEKFSLNSMPAKTGYTPDGYYYNDTKIAGKDGQSLVPFTYKKDIVVTMVYTPNQYTIAMSNTSISNNRQSVTFDSSFVLPKLSNNSTGAFIGWYYEDTQLTDADGKSLKPYNYAKSITVTPKFKSNFVVTYKGSEVLVKFNSNGGTTIPSQKVSLSNPLKYPSIPTKAGYVFAGWYKDSSLLTAFNFTETLSNDITLYAKWIYPTKTYNGIVSLNSTTGTTVSYSTDLTYYAFVPLVTQEIKVYSTGNGDVVGLIYNHYLAEMKRDDDSGTGGNFEMTYTVQANTLYYIGVKGYYYYGTCQLYLTGDKTTPTVTSQISGTAGFNKTVTYGSDYTLQVVNRPGLTFKGYYLDPEFNTKITDATGKSLAPWTFTEDITVYAKYE